MSARSLERWQRFFVCGVSCRSCFGLRCTCSDVCPGRFGNTTGLTSAKCTALCSSGYYCRSAAAEQILCEPGNECLAGASAPAPCAAGGCFSNFSSSMGCFFAGTFWQSASLPCVGCAVGRFSANASLNCTDSPAGSYLPPNTAKPLPCELNTYNPAVVRFLYLFPLFFAHPFFCSGRDCVYCVPCVILYTEERQHRVFTNISNQLDHYRPYLRCHWRRPSNMHLHFPNVYSKSRAPRYSDYKPNINGLLVLVLCFAGN